jgi:hypothetical protein
LTTGVVIDAFGNKLVEVPEPPMLSLIGLTCMGWWVAGRRKAAGTWKLALAGLLFVVDGAYAQKTTQKTKANQIGATVRSAAPPRPAAPNVCVQHTVTVEAKTGNTIQV